MFLTDETLEKYNACGAGRKLFNKLYPNGVEIMDLLDNKHIPKEMLWWGETWLPVSNEELNKLYKILEIKDSENVSCGKNIRQSENIYNCQEVEMSEFIKNSSFIYRSAKITGSQKIESSAKVSSSINVKGSQKIVNSKDINDSRNIVNSSNIKSCDNIFNGKNLDNCDTLYNSSFNEDCGFSSFVTESQKLLFCTNIARGQFLLFNKSISRTIFDKIWMEFKERIKYETIIMIKNLKSEDNYDDYYDVYAQNNYKDFFKFLSDDFKKWIRTLPGFDEFTMYSITFNEEWLNDQ